MILALTKTFLSVVFIWFLVGCLAYCIKRQKEGCYKLDIVVEWKHLFRASLFGPIFIHHTFYKAKSRNTIRFWVGILGAIITMIGFFVGVLNENSFTTLLVIASILILVSTMKNNAE